MPCVISPLLYDFAGFLKPVKGILIRKVILHSILFSLTDGSGSIGNDLLQSQFLIFQQFFENGILPGGAFPYQAYDLPHPLCNLYHMDHIRGTRFSQRHSGSDHHHIACLHIARLFRF